MSCKTKNKIIMEGKKTILCWALQSLDPMDVGPFLWYCSDYFIDPGSMATSEEFDKVKDGFEY